MESLAADLHPAVFFAAGFVFLIVCLLISRMLRRRREIMGTFASPREESRAREELEQLMVQMQEVAREQIAKADAKIRMLNQLLAEADEKKKELESLLGAASRPAPPKPAPKPGNPLHEKVWGLHDQGKSPQEICAEAGLEIGEVDMILGLRKLKS